MSLPSCLHRVQGVPETRVRAIRMGEIPAVSDEAAHQSEHSVFATTVDLFGDRR